MASKEPFDLSGLITMLEARMASEAILKETVKRLDSVLRLHRKRPDILENGWYRLALWHLCITCAASLQTIDKAKIALDPKGDTDTTSQAPFVPGDMLRALFSAIGATTYEEQWHILEELQGINRVFEITTTGQALQVALRQLANSLHRSTDDKDASAEGGA